MNLQLENKTALVTGSTKGIGFAIARLLTAEGANVIVNGRSEDSIRAARKRLATVRVAWQRMCEPQPVALN